MTSLEHLVIMTLLVSACSSGRATEQPREQSLALQSLVTTGEDTTELDSLEKAVASVPSISIASAAGTAPAKTRTRPAYPLDNVSRKVAMSGKVSCPPVELVNYQGEKIPYQKKARVYVGFAQHLRRFEEIVAETAIEVYGRAPSKIITYGSYYCRRIRSWPYLISEHGLGNALDVAGFEFKKMSGPNAGSLPRSLRRSFKVSMSKHWNARAKDKVHQRFLRTLARAVINEEGLFRVILGPADPKHHDHFHFDMAPFRIVNVF
ncbi:MAG: extensin family protein [Kofleriaceae bacterium]|nr:extensin family protein [Kofleriaceae bacterium]